MVSRTWSTVKRMVLILIFSTLTAGFLTGDARAAGGGACQLAYGLTPTPLPEWLKPAAEEMDLSTAYRYDLLAGRLLATGLVDASACPGYGRNPEGSPNACGLDKSRDAVTLWQNQYDPVILLAARAGDLPPALLKAVIAVESQFWPAADWIKGEIGLGQMTEWGADLVLAWRPAYYQAVCRRGLPAEKCDTAFRYLDASDQRLLRGLVLQEIDATCPACPGGVDVGKGQAAIQVLSETLNASCAQTARVVRMATGTEPSSLMSYEDFWRLALANYHAGAGCTYYALRGMANAAGGDGTTQSVWNWNQIAGHFSTGCASGGEYIRRIEAQIKP